MLIMLVDGDGRLSGRELKSVAIAGPSGVGLTTTIVRDVKALIGQSIAADGSAIVMVKDQDDVTRAIVVGTLVFAFRR